MKQRLVFVSLAMFIAFHPARTVATETGLSVDDSGAPLGAPAPHGEVAPPHNPLKHQMTGSAVATLPPEGSSSPDMPTPVGNRKQSAAGLFPDEKANGAPLDGLSKTPPTSAPAAVGQLSKPASKPVSETTPTLVAKGPGAIVIPRENCGTYHTGWVDDPNADVNPCPAHCERGERLWINSHANGNKTEYDGAYRCYLPELVIEPPPLAAMPPGAPPRRNCGTVWTGREAGPLADVNPCPANCERGELRGVRRGRSDDALYFEMNYQCYLAEPGTRSVSASGAQAGAGRSSGSKPVIPVTGVPQGVRIADGQTATSTSAVDTAPAASALKHPAVVEREVSTRNIVPGPTLLAVTGEDATTASVIWRPLPGASVYQVHAKATGINHSLTGVEVRQPVLDGANQPGLPSAMNYLLSGLAPGVEHNVWVTVKYPDGSSGTSDLRTVTTGGAENPAGFMAFPIVMPGIPGAVRLEWQLRRGATHYLVAGSNLPRTPTTNTTFVVPDIRTPGTHSWTVIAVYPGGVHDDRQPPRASVTCAQSASEQRVVCSRDRSP